MNRMPRFLAILLILISIGTVCPAQERPKAVLVDEFGEITCEDLLARADNFAYRLSKEPMASGIAVLHGKLVNRRYISFFADLITGAVFMRGSARNHLVVFLDPKERDLRGELWLVPSGAERPNFSGEIIGSTPPDFSNPVLAGKDSGDNICSTFSPDSIANILRERPDLSLHIIIYNMSARDRAESAIYWRKSFVSEHNVSKDRLKITFAHKGTFPLSEFWLVPARQK